MEQQTTIQTAIWRERVGCILFTGATLTGIALVLAVCFPINRSNSMPHGVYRYVSRPVERGEIVGACIREPYARLARERGYLSLGICRESIRPVMKYVAAVVGDVVNVQWSGISVNDVDIPETALLRSDLLGRPLPNQLGIHVMQPGEYWLLSNRDKGSFDSRYFGPVTGILGVVVPLLLSPSTEAPPPPIDFQRIGASRQ